MASTYKTPGVYIEEVSKFPPSVAAVETAIPAFIGYTEKADEINNNDLHLQPTRISSMLEYERYFGGGHQPPVNEVIIDGNNIYESVDLKTQYYLYQAIGLFFRNGGGDCYIISVGLYSDENNALGDYEAGLEKLKKEDEPTLILFPDAVLMEDHADIYNLQIQALEQCAKLGDRFCIFDLCETDPNDPNFAWEDGVSDFRDKIGMRNLKYGAAYTPQLKANSGANFSFGDIYDKIKRGGVAIDLETLAPNTDVVSTVQKLKNIISDIDTIATAIDTLNGGQATMDQAFQVRVDTFNGTNNNANLLNIITMIYDMVIQIDDWAQNLDYNPLKLDIDNLIANTLLTPFSELVINDKGANTALSTTTFAQYSPIFSGSFNTSTWGDPAGINGTSTIYSGSTNSDKRSNALPGFYNLFIQFNAAFNAIVETAANYEKELNKDLYETHPVYKNLINSLNGQLATVPPSGAIAGIYASVDSERGVWKAPANVSLNGVTGLTETIDNSDQERLNVDPLAGKSINAIRAFTGKGLMVWGARTLAGNDNEWRFISVRRFFNMAEESIKKATSQFVFEANDANTWVKVRAMIENFLILQWRAGALAGAKPEEAFYVKVGLSETMTAQDILEGRMIVEIGMAVVRPAEFIILQFSHKMQES